MITMLYVLVEANSATTTDLASRITFYVDERLTAFNVDERLTTLLTLWNVELHF